MNSQQYFKEDKLAYTIWDKKYRYNNESLEDWFKRVSGNNPKIETLIKQRKFLFGGRTLSNRGVKDGSYSNCYSVGYVPDSLKEILEVNSQLGMTYKAQGGQGASLSKLRPKGASIKGLYNSDGIIPFMKLFNQTTDCISQGGSRKGALLLSLDIWHKEAPDFITIKSNEDSITKANLSLEIDNVFMQSVERCLNNNTTEVIPITRRYGNSTVEYEVDVLKLYKLLCKYAHDHAEPGVIFTDVFRNYNIMEYVPSYNIETCNPCGEQPLPKHGSCNLGSINISEYIVNPFTPNAFLDLSVLLEDVASIVEAMDDVLTENISRHALPKQKEIAEKYRNIGIGIMGLADTCIKLNLVYGSKKAVDFSRQLAYSIFKKAVIESAKLAEIRGNFPGYSKEVWESSIIRNTFTEADLRQLKAKDKLRNCSLISIAPTGSIGTMLNISTGIEPLFALNYIRKTESLEGSDVYYNVDAKIVEEYKAVTGNVELNDTFVVANEIHWKDRIAMQAAFQEFTDTAISSTINLPASTPVEEIEKIYLQGWISRLKGLTVYVEGSRSPILSRNPIQSERLTPKRPKELDADYHQIKVKGELFIILIGLLNDKPYEVFAFKPLKPISIDPHKGRLIKVKKMHYKYDSDHIRISDLQLSNSNIAEKAITINASQALRHGIPIKFIIKTIKKVDENITSFASAVCRVLSLYINNETTGENCPECGESIIREGGCLKCISCTFSKCE